jgi:glycine C-acetyltransferase
LKRLVVVANNPELKDKLWENVHALQNGLNKGFIGDTNTVTRFILRSVPEAMVMVNDLRKLRYFLVDCNLSCDS